MEIHHDKHHGAYVTNSNKALEGNEFADKSVEDVLTSLSSLPSDKQGPVRNNAGGHYNHTLFWESMGPGGGGEQASGARFRRNAIASTFGSFSDFQGALKAAGVGPLARAGRGWCTMARGSPSSRRRTRTLR